MPRSTGSSVSNGSGFGLAITNGFVRQSGGRLFLANRIGGGLIATMVFPLASPPAETANAPDLRAAHQARSIRVVDDEPTIAKAVGELLETEGYLVAIATSIREARRGAARRRDPDPAKSAQAQNIL